MTTIALIALVVSVLAFGVSIWTASLNKRSAVAAEDSSVSADRAADAAKASAESAARVARAEIERDHESWRPIPTESGFEVRPGYGDVQGDVVFVFTMPRSYQVAGVLQYDNGHLGWLALDPPSALEAGHGMAAHLGKSGSRLPSMLKLSFWPPAPDDPGEGWTCPCDRPAAPDHDPAWKSKAHWVWNIPVPPDLDYDIMDSLG